MRREAVTKRVCGSRLRDPCCGNRAFDGTLHGLLIHMVPPYDTATRIGRLVVGGEQPEPAPLNACAGILALQCVRQHDAAAVTSPVIVEQNARRGNLFT